MEKRILGYGGATVAAKQCRKFSTVDSDGILSDDEFGKEPMDVRMIKAAMIERAWNDLACSHEITQAERRSAINWFEGNGDKNYILTFDNCCSNCGEFNPERKEKLRARIREAEKFNREEATSERELKGRTYAADGRDFDPQPSNLELLYKLGLRVRPEDEEAREISEEIEDLEYIAV